MNQTIPKLLWIDSLGALAVGIFVLIGSGFLAGLYGLSFGTVVTLALVNLIYGCYSFSLARRAHRPVSLIRVLAIANMCWAPVCIYIVVLNRTEITLLGMCHLLGEAVYVGGLGVMEWRYRFQLTNQN